MGDVIIVHHVMGSTKTMPRVYEVSPYQDSSALCRYGFGF
jgi:hypothetical protein